MNPQTRLSLSYYREIASLNTEHQISLVQHVKSGKIFVKKTLDIFYYPIYQKLRDNPLKGIPKIYELLEDNDQLILIEEYISGDTLEEILQSQGTLPETLVSEYMLQLCDILFTLHRQKPAIIHRDIKPSNIIITPSNQVVLLDFNAAKYVNSTKEKDTVLLGTKGFAAPEQYGFGSSNVQADIYAIGALINTLLTGHLPGINLATGKFQSIIQKCTKMDPSERYPSVKEVQNALLELHLCPGRDKNAAPYSGSWLPPGFRSKNVFHMCIALIGYSMIFYFGSTLLVENATPVTLTLERIFSVLMMLAIVFFTCNYRNVQNVFPFCTHPNKKVKYIAIFLYNWLFAFLIIFFMILIENAFASFL